MYITLAFFLVSGIFFELFTATSQQQHIANKTAESSADFQSIQNTEIVIKPDASSAAELAKAERRLTQCKVKLARREVPHCDGDATAVSSLQRSQQASNSSIGGAVDKAITAKTDSMLKITEEKNKPLFKMIRDEFNVTINTGMIIAVAIMIFIFEVTHITNLFVYAGRIRRFRQLEAGLDDMRGQYHQLTGNDYTPPCPTRKNHPDRPVPRLPQRLPLCTGVPGCRLLLCRGSQQHQPKRPRHPGQ